MRINRGKIKKLTTSERIKVVKWVRGEWGIAVNTGGGGGKGVEVMGGGGVRGGRVREGRGREMDTLPSACAGATASAFQWHGGRGVHGA